MNAVSSETGGEYTTLVRLEEMMRLGRWTEANAYLRKLAPEQMSESEILMVLTITSYGKTRLVERPTFLATSERVLVERLGDERASILLERRR